MNLKLEKSEYKLKNCNNLCYNIFTNTYFLKEFIYSEPIIFLLIKIVIKESQYLTNLSI